MKEIVKFKGRHLAMCNRYLNLLRGTTFSDTDDLIDSDKLILGALGYSHIVTPLIFFDILGGATFSTISRRYNISNYEFRAIRKKVKETDEKQQ